MVQRMDRRGFLGLAVLAGLAASFDWPESGDAQSRASPAQDGVLAYRRSGRKRHVSRAAKAHNANHVYATYNAAMLDPAHPGDKSRVVPVLVSASLFQAFFGNGRQSVDLRHDLYTLNDYERLRACLGGPNRPAGTACTAQDLSHNGAVDLRDMSIFQRIFTGQ